MFPCPLIAGQVAVSELIWTWNTLCTGTGRVIVLIGREGESTCQSVDSTQVPATEDRIDYAVIQMRMAAAKWNFVVKAQHPAQLLVEVGHATLCSQVIAVLRKRRVAANFRQIIDGFAIRKSA